MYSSLITKQGLVNKCLTFVESRFPIKFTRKTYDNQNLKLFFKVSWFTAEPLSVALVIMRKKYWHITHIVTHENFREEGYGTKLLKMVTKEAKKAKIEYISCNIRTDNFVSQAFFISNGFIEQVAPKDKSKPDFVYYRKDLIKRLDVLT